MRLIIAGGRHLDDIALIRSALVRSHAIEPLTVLIHGGNGALGITAEDWAREMRLHVVRYPANWREFGKRAEAIRNAFMLEASRPDMLLALPGGNDTADLVAGAFARSAPVIDPEGKPVTIDKTGKPNPSAPDPARRGISASSRKAEG
jgi:NADPH:quinone reductase-like Zn-dependent oxidoreductase